MTSTASDDGEVSGRRSFTREAMELFVGVLIVFSAVLLVGVLPLPTVLRLILGLSILSLGFLAFSSAQKRRLFVAQRIIRFRGRPIRVLSTDAVLYAVVFVTFAGSMAFNVVDGDWFGVLSPPLFVGVCMLLSARRPHGEPERRASAPGA